MNKLILLVLIFILNLNSDDSILSKGKLEILKLEKEKLKQESAKLTKDWINPINLSIQKSYDKNYETTSSIISINQPIFRSGGIYSAIKYAKNLYKYSSLTLEAQKKELIKNATLILFNIKILEYQILKQKKLLQNAKITLQAKEEGRDAGLLNQTLIYDSIIDVENIEELIIDLELQRDNLITNFKTLSDKKIDELQLPTLKLISLEEFKKNNLQLQINKQDIDVKDNYKYMTIARYLPSVNLFYNYTKYQNNTNPLIRDDDNYNYGISLTIPLDIKSLNTIQSSRIDYLKSKITYLDKQKEEELFFENLINKIKNIDKRKQKALSATQSYDKKLKSLKEDYKSGFITKDSLDLYKNKKESKEYDIKIYELQKQIELLELYAKLENNDEF